MKLPKIRKSLIHKLMAYSDKGYSFQQIALVTQIPEEELRLVAFKYMYSIRELHMRDLSTSFQEVENLCHKMLSDPKLSTRDKRECQKLLKNTKQARKDLGICIEKEEI